MDWKGEPRSRTVSSPLVARTLLDLVVERTIQVGSEVEAEVVAAVTVARGVLFREVESNDLSHADSLLSSLIGGCDWVSEREARKLIWEWVGEVNRLLGLGSELGCPDFGVVGASTTTARSNSCMDAGIELKEILPGEGDVGGVDRDSRVSGTRILLGGGGMWKKLFVWICGCFLSDLVEVPGACEGGCTKSRRFCTSE